MRTQAEILQRITDLADIPDDFFGFQRSDLSDYLDFEAAKPFLKDGVTAEQYGAPKEKNDASVIAQIVDYLPFAWEKANDCRGLSAGRSISHMQAWLWMLGEDVAAERIGDYTQYGKPQLRAISEAVGFDWRAAGSGGWTDNGMDEWPAPADTIDIGLTRSFV